MKLSLATIKTKEDLINHLLETTNAIIIRINAFNLYEQGKLSDTESYKLELVKQNRILKLKVGYLPDKDSPKVQFRDILKEWLDDEIEFINGMSPFLQNIETQKTNLFTSILGACNKIQQNKLYWNADEDTRTKAILDFLDPKYQTKDQSHYGKSDKGLKPGSVDGVIKDENNIDHFIEALNLKSIDKSYIHLHIKKLEENYDSKGLRNKYVIIYCNIQDNTFEPFFEKYQSFLKTDCKFRFPLNSIDILKNDYTNQRLIKTTHYRESEEVNLYHILLKMPII